MNFIIRIFNLDRAWYKESILIFKLRRRNPVACSWTNIYSLNTWSAPQSESVLQLTISYCRRHMGVTTAPARMILNTLPLCISWFWLDLPPPTTSTGLIATVRLPVIAPYVPEAFYNSHVQQASVLDWRRREAKFCHQHQSRGYCKMIENAGMLSASS